MLYVDLPDTPLRPSPRDQWLARQLHEQNVPLSIIESALLLATLRRLIRPTGLPPLSPIRSLAYFQPVIDELQQQPLPDGYLDYLRLKRIHHMKTVRGRSRNRTVDERSSRRALQPSDAATSHRVVGSSILRSA